VQPTAEDLQAMEAAQEELLESIEDESQAADIDAAELKKQLCPACGVLATDRHFDLPEHGKLMTKFLEDNNVDLSDELKQYLQDSIRVLPLQKASEPLTLAQQLGPGQQKYLVVLLLNPGNLNSEY